MKKVLSKMKRVLSLVMAFVLVLGLVPATAMAAGETKTVYLKAGVWETANAWFDAWVFGSSQADAWYTFEDADGDGVYSADIPADATGMKILRKDPASKEHNWNEWNNTGDLVIGSTYNCYEITGWGNDNVATGKWTTYTYVAPTYTVVGEGGLFGGNWDPANTANDMTEVSSGKYQKVFENVAAGTYKYKVVRNRSFDVCYGDPSNTADYNNVVFTVAEDDSTVTITFVFATKTVSHTVVKEYAVAFGDHVGATVTGAATAEKDKSYTFNVAVNDGYELKEDGIAVAIDGTPVEFAYDAEAGTVTVAADKITGDLEITVKATEKLPDTKTIYLKANSSFWDKDGAWFIAEVNSNKTQMIDENLDGVYTVEIPYEATSIKFYRMDSGAADASGNVWNKTADLTIGGNCYTITGWGETAGTWSTVTPSTAGPVLTVVGDTGLCGSNWDLKDSDNGMTKNASGVYEKTFNNVAAGNYKFKIARDHSWDVAYGDPSNSSDNNNVKVTVETAGSTVVISLDPTNRNKVSAKVTAPTVTPDPEEHTVTFDGTNVTSSNNATSIEDGADYTTTLTAATGYTLPETVSVTVAGVDAEHEYNATTGELKIPAVSGDVVITAAGVAEVPSDTTVYCINSANWAQLSAYYWTDGGAGISWPGVAMTKTSQTVNGFDVYSITFDPSYEQIIFNNNGNGSQTPDLDVQPGKYYDVKGVAWYDSLEDVPAVDELASDVYLVGDFNGWNTTANEFKLTAVGAKTATATMDLAAATDYGFKVMPSGVWYGCNATITESTTEGLQFTTSGGNCKLTTGEAGTYTFTYDLDSKKLSVAFPEKTEPGEDVSYEATFHFANTLDWSVVNLYTWIGSGTPLTGTWPGSATTLSGGYYNATVTYTAPAGQDLNFIFNDGSTQTIDLALPAADFKLDGEVYKAEKWVVLTTQVSGKYDAAIVDSPEAIVASPIVDGSSVTFNYGNNKATSVFVAGSFNGWSTTATSMTKNADGVWTATVNNLDAGDYQYKFVVDGNWILDPMNSNVVTEANDNQNSAFYILSDETEPDDNTVTIRIHYTREDGKYDGWNLWVWGSNMGGHQVDFAEELVDGAKVATIVLDNARDHQSISFKERLSVEGDDWKDQGSMDRTIDLSTIVSGTIDYYIPSGNVVYGDDIIRKNKISSVEVDYDSNAIALTAVQAIANYEAALKLVKGEEEINATITAVGSKYYMALPQGEEINLKELYQYKVKYYGSPYSVAIDPAYASDKFAEKFTYDGKDLGANYTSSKTTFKLWAPTAEVVHVKLYATGSDSEASAKDLGEHLMTEGEKGVWTVTVDGDLNGKYYTYEVKVGGKTVEAIDPYARTAGVNGERGMVIDLDSTDPSGGWSEASYSSKNYTDAILYELHVRDFSIDDSSGVKDEWQGKFLGLTETDTKTPGGSTTGLDYLKDLGITHLHLLPIYDYASVNEANLDKAQYNWGYDPQNYNVPEGSYSTNPYDGKVRVQEMKQMVDVLHENDINVVMDVVYNHVYDSDTFSFNQIVPGYFSRVSSNESGCGNDTASEREMVRKYIVDSVVYWATEYHIDGFRFDLVGLIDVETINQIVTEVHKVRPDAIFYGEGWDMDKTNKEPGTQMAKQGNASKTPEFAYFSDNMRNDLGGDNGKSKGFASGADGKEGSIASNFMARPWWTSNPNQVVQYASCHDNHTLADKIILSTGKSELDAEVIKMNNLAAAVYMTSQGIPFIHAGEEMLREKLYESGKREENSYNKGDYVNHIAWDKLDSTKFDYAANVDYYKGLIEFRKAHPVLSLDSSKEISNRVVNQKAADKIVSFWLDGTEINGEADSIYVIFNANSSARTIELPAGEWETHVNATEAGTTNLQTVSGTVSVPGVSAMILVQEESTESPTPKSEVALPGSFNEWNQANFMDFAENSTTVTTQTLSLPEGNYEFKIKIGEKWYGNSGTIEDSTTTGWVMDANVGDNCKLKASGGAYTFTFDTTTKQLSVAYDPNGGEFGDPNEYFLWGYINAADYGGGLQTSQYKFDEDGKLTATFSSDTYVAVKNGDASKIYMTDGYLGGVTSAIMYDTKDPANKPTGENEWDKMLIPTGMEVTFTLVLNNDGTVTLSYEADVKAVADTSGVQDGVTLHCWNWSFAEIEANMAEIAAQGYTAIQTSPIQPLKEATNLSTNTVGKHWWLYYQPIDFEITTQSGNALGTKDELISMIKTAHKYDVKVIVDVVANHLANQTGNNLSSAIPEYLRADKYWHDISMNTNDWNNRYEVTQYCMGGLPDLNTSNDDIQGYVLDFLKECVDAGVDGFRFDAAKSIETPMDDANIASDFWPTVIGGAEEHAKEKYGKDLYIYGEILDTTKGVSLLGYTQYMAITDNSWGNALRGNIASDKAALRAGYDKAAPASALVLWAESHDTYATDDAYQSSLNISDEDIVKTWALVAARKDAMGLYFARPESMTQALGVASVTDWASDEVEQINKFHNAFVDENEYISNENGISYVERGDSGVVLVKAVDSASSDISVTANLMKDGAYVDQITGTTFTVANGKITGTIGDTGIAVVYNAAEETKYTVTVESVNGGTVTSDKEEAALGETVTVTVKADEGKVLETITVTDADDNEITLTKGENGTYTFGQPASNVTVKATFIAETHTHTVKWVDEDGEEIDSVTVNHGEGIDEADIPTVPEKDGYTGAWSVTDLAEITEDLTIEPVYTAVEYENDVKESGSGSVEINPTKPVAGDKVTVTVTPDEGIEAEGIVVKDASGKEIPVTENEDGTYSFTQPVGEVTVEALFKAAYKIIKGDGSKIVHGSDNTITITVNGAYNKFRSIKIDGELVKTTNYTAKAGSTIITLKAEYLKTLEEGEHTITVIYTDGETEGTFYLNAKSDGTTTPPTGDNSQLGMWIGMITVSTLAMAAVLMLQRKKKQA